MIIIITLQTVHVNMYVLIYLLIHLPTHLLIPLKKLFKYTNAVFFVRLYDLGRRIQQGFFFRAVNAVQ